jgi:hypothetical protein
LITTFSPPSYISKIANHISAASIGTPQHLMSGLLLDAAREGDLVKVQRLIREGANVHEVDPLTGFDALMCAAFNSMLLSCSGC